MKNKMDKGSNAIREYKDRFRFDLDVVVYEKGKHFISYCPALDLSSFGISKEDALASFDEAFDLFMDDILAKGTLDTVLASLGWLVLNKPKKTYQPPHLNLQEVFKLHPVDVSQKAISVNG